MRRPDRLLRALSLVADALIVLGSFLALLDGCRGLVTVHLDAGRVWDLRGIGAVALLVGVVQVARGPLAGALGACVRRGVGRVLFWLGRWWRCRPAPFSMPVSSTEPETGWVVRRMGRNGLEYLGWPSNHDDPPWVTSEHAFVFARRETAEEWALEKGGVAGPTSLCLPASVRGVDR